MPAIERSVVTLRICGDDLIPQDITDMLGVVTVWQNITRKYRADLFCGLFMSETNDGLSISPQSLACLAERGIDLGLDIYAPADADRKSGT